MSRPDFAVKTVISGSTNDRPTHTLAPKGEWGMVQIGAGGIQTVEFFSSVARYIPRGKRNYDRTHEGEMSTLHEARRNCDSPVRSRNGQ